MGFHFVSNTTASIAAADANLSCNQPEIASVIAAWRLSPLQLKQLLHRTHCTSPMSSGTLA
jgi:hypothetical protein